MNSKSWLSSPDHCRQERLTQVSVWRMAIKGSNWHERLCFIPLLKICSWWFYFNYERLCELFMLPNGPRKMASSRPYSSSQTPWTICSLWYVVVSKGWFAGVGAGLHAGSLILLINVHCMSRAWMKIACRASLNYLARQHSYQMQVTSRARSMKWWQSRNGVNSRLTLAGRKKFILFDQLGLL